MTIRRVAGPPPELAPSGFHPSSTDAVGCLSFDAAPALLEAIAGLGRTEDLRFSPSNRRLAIAAFLTGRIAVFDLQIAQPDQIALTGGALLTSSTFRYPHGLDFLDDDTLIVANRGGDVVAVDLPPGDPAIPTCEVQPRTLWPAGERSPFLAPGSVVVAPEPEGKFELLVCDNDAHTVSRMRGWRTPGRLQVSNPEVLVSRWLDIPDGLAVSPDGEWLAVSNHNPHNVLLYRRSGDPQSAPEGLLRCVNYPHGLRFTADGGQLLVADAGGPFVHVFSSAVEGWHGVRAPTSVRVMDEDTYARGNRNPQEGGPKGLDIDSAGSLVALTSEHQPLAFFSLPEMLTRCEALATAELEHELRLMDDRRSLNEQLELARTAIGELKGSLSWRLTEPLRRLRSALERRKRRR